MSRNILISITALAVGFMVATCGPIGFVGIIAPHACRIIIPGVRHRMLALCSFLIGASFLTISDTIARGLLNRLKFRSVISRYLFGGPFFLIVLFRRKPFDDVSNRGDSKTVMNTCNDKSSAFQFFCSWSGGKDSCLALFRMLNAGNVCRCLFTMIDETGEHSRSHGLTPELLERQSRMMNRRYTPEMQAGKTMKMNSEKVENIQAKRIISWSFWRYRFGTTPAMG